MEELRKINRKICIKQIMRIILGTGFMISGMTMLFKFAHQSGVKLNQSFMRSAFPEEYEQIDKKVLQLIEENKDHL